MEEFHQDFPMVHKQKLVQTPGESEPDTIEKCHYHNILPLTSVSGSIFAIYTSLLWFIYKAVRRSVNANWHFFSPKNCARRAGNHKTIIRAGSRMPSLSVPLAVVATTRQIQTVVLALSWINRLASKKLSSPSVRVVASCREAVASVQPCVVQHTK